MGMLSVRIIILWHLIHASIAGKSVDVLNAGLSANLGEDDILHVLERQNETASQSKNFTFIELISNIIVRDNESIPQEDGPSFQQFWHHQHANVYYDDFAKEIDNEASLLFKVLPAFNPGEGSVSAECKKQSSVFDEELKKFSLWALKMFDASAKVPSGLLSGNVNQLGDFDECIGIEGKHGIKGQYCLAHMQIDIDKSRPYLKFIHRLLHSHYAFRSNMTDPGHRVPRFSTVHWALCVPSACSSQDVEASMKDTLGKYTKDTGIKFTVKVQPEMCQVKQFESLPIATILAGCFFIGIITLAIISGLCDQYNVPVNRVVSAFSLKKNVEKLVSLKRNDGDIETLHGIRALNAFMLILSHKSLAMFFNPYTNRTQVVELIGQPWTVIGRAASLYTDPFLMLSGLLTTYSFVGRLNKGKQLRIFNEYLSRLFRIVPTLGALILFCTYVMPFIGSGPQWNLAVTQHADICKRTWWRNFLFIHNYFGFENMCLTHTHHLGIDMQLFAISPLMILLLYKRPRIGFVVLTSIAAASTALRYYVTYDKNLNNYVHFSTSIRQLFDTANMSYILPIHRLTVYILGIFMGYLLRSWPKNQKLNERFVRIGWFVSTIMCLAATFGPAKMGSIDYVYNRVHAATYNAFSPIGWCALFMWVIFLVHTGNTNGWLSKLFSWKGFLISTRFSYAVYLTQFPVFFYNIGQTRSSEHCGFIRELLNIYEFLWIILTSAALTLLFDMPFQNLKNQFLKAEPEPSEKQLQSSKMTKME